MDPITPQPCERPLHHPTLGQQQPAYRLRRAAHQLQHKVLEPPYPARQPILAVGTIGPHHFQPRERPLRQVLQDGPCPHRIGDTRGRDDDSEQQAHGIHGDMPLAARDLLGPVVAVRPAHRGRLDRLAVDDRHAGRWLPAGGDTHLLTQFLEQLFPGPVPLPPLRVVVDRLPGGEVMRQTPPGAALAIAIEQGVDDLTDVNFTGTAAGASQRNQRFQQQPLLVGRVTGVRLAVHAAELQLTGLMEQAREAAATVRPTWLYPHRSWDYAGCE